MFTKAIRELKLKSDFFDSSGNGSYSSLGVASSSGSGEMGGFLCDIHPRNKRVSLHQDYCLREKNEEILKGYLTEEQSQEPIFPRISPKIDSIPIASSSLSTTSTSFSSSMSKKRTRDESLTSDDDNYDSVLRQQSLHTNEALPYKNSFYPPSTGNISIYHKFFSYFQTFYNEHDTLSIMTALLYPCCNPAVSRYCYLWSSLINPVKMNPSISESIQKPVLIASKAQNGLVSIENAYEKIFTSLPDSIPVYFPIRRKLSSDGSVIMYAPFTYMCTIPKITIMSEEDGKETINQTIEGTEATSENVIENISVELDGCSIVTYSSQGVVISSTDHYFHIRINHSKVTPKHIMKYFDY